MKKKLGLYIHIPFCRSKCYYCDFYSIVYDRGLIDRYLKNMEKEILLYSQQYARTHVIDTVFIGGGTPTMLEGRQIKNLMAKVNGCFTLLKNAEITIESNPESLTGEHLRVFREMNINRISLGVQTFQDRILKLTNRPTDREEILKKIGLIKKFKMSNLSLDLIFGLPEQTFSVFKQDLKTALDFRPQHLSLYGLMMDKKTPLYKLYLKKKSIFPTDEDHVRFYQYARHLLERHKWVQYEISNFARPGFACRHNLKYWKGAEYLGIGASATSTMDRRRWTNICRITDYSAKLEAGERPVMKYEKLTKTKTYNEKVMLRLRLREGLVLKDLEPAERRILESKKGEIRELVQMGLLQSDGSRLTIPLKGTMVSNEVISWLMV